MRKKNFSAVFTLFLLLPTSITWAQVTKTLNGTVRYESGMSETKFSTPNGNVVMKLPQSMSGAVITGTVSTEPAGSTEKEKSRNLKVLLKFVVKLDGQQIPLSATPQNFDWVTHLDRHQRTAVELLHVSGVKAFELSLPPVLPAPAKMVWQPDRTPLLTTPSNVLVKGDALNIYTDQQFSTGQKFILTDSKGQQFTVKPVCLSSNQAVINVPENVIPGEITVREEVWNQPISGYSIDKAMKTDNTGKVKFNLIGIDLTSPNTNLRNGQTSSVTLSIKTKENLSGLDSNEFMVFRVDVRNLTPGVVDMAGGNLQAISFPLSENRQNPAAWQLSRTITGIKPGNFSVSATLHEDYNTSNDPFRPQLNVLKTPEDFNAWANALKKDLNQYKPLLTDDDIFWPPTTQDYSVIKTNAQRAIDHMPVCTSPEQLDESKAVAYSLIRPINIPKHGADFWLSGFEAWKAASKAIPATLSNNPQLIDWQVIKNGLAYISRMGKQIGYGLQDGTVEAQTLIEQVQKTGETKEMLEKLNGTIQELNVRMNKLLDEMPVASMMLLPGGILFSTKFTPPGMTDLTVEVIDISWGGHKSSATKNGINLVWHFTGDITVKGISLRVNWVSKDGKKSSTADMIWTFSKTGAAYKYCDSLRAWFPWPDSFTPSGIDMPLPKDELDLEKFKVTVFVNGKKVGEGKPEESKPEDK